MADFVFNIAKGRAAELAAVPGSALVAVPLEQAGLEDDSILMDYDTLADLLTGASVEQTEMGRVTLSVTVAVSDVANWSEVSAGAFSWPAATGAATGAVLICYVPEPGISTDSALIPLTKHDLVLIPSGSDISVAGAVIYRAQ